MGLFQKHAILFTRWAGSLKRGACALLFVTHAKGKHFLLSKRGNRMLSLKSIIASLKAYLIKIKKLTTNRDRRKSFCKDKVITEHKSLK